MNKHTIFTVLTILASANAKVSADPAAVKSVIAALDAAGGSYEKNDVGGLKSVDLAAKNLSIKEKRTTDPFDQKFYENLARVPGLESVNIINTTAENAWLAPLGTIKTLKSLRIINQAKLDDEGLAHLAPLSQLENFGYIGTKMTGEPIKNFKGWTNLKSASFRGSKMNDAGLMAICDYFPNLESLVLAHGDYSDVAVDRLAGLTKLKGLEVGSHRVTPYALQFVVRLPLEYLQLGEGFDSSETIAIAAKIKTLKRLTLTNCKAVTDDDLRVVAGIKSLETLELVSLELPEERLAVLRDFAFLKTLKLIRRPMPYDAELQAKVRALLPQTTLAFE